MPLFNLIRGWIAPLIKGALGSCLIAAAVHAGVSPDLSSRSPAYEIVDRLESFGCAFSTYRLIRPQAYEDFRTSVDWDEENSQCRAPEWLMLERQILLIPALLPQLSFEVMASKQDRVGGQGFGTGNTALFPQRSGRPYFDGVNLLTEFALSSGSGSEKFGYALSVRPGWIAALRNFKYPNGRVYFQEGSIKIGYKWAELSFGRIADEWGDARHGNLLMSGAAAPMDKIKFALRPHVVGTPLGFLGPMTLQAWLGVERDPTEKVPGSEKGAKWFGAILGSRPFGFFEWAFLGLGQWGGSEPASASQQTSQTYLGGLASIWLFSKGLKLSGQVIKRMAAQGQLDEGPGYLASFWLPRIFTNGDFRVEGVRIPKGYFLGVGSTIPQGFSYLGSIVGHPLSAENAWAVYADLGFVLFKSWRIRLSGGLEERKGIQDLEQRTFGGLGWVRRFGSFELSASGFYSWVKNRDGVSASLQGYPAGQVLLTYLLM